MKNRYAITRDYISYGWSRPGTSLERVRFIVSHDTGNPGSTARQNRAYFNRHVVKASAHTFVDDGEILEIIPLTEKAYHVRYEVTADNRKFGANANDAAIGVELCYGSGIDFEAAYERYVWYHAYLCRRFSLNPLKDIVGHDQLDPSRRTDPQHVFLSHNLTMNQFLSDVRKVYEGQMKGKRKEDRILSLGDRGSLVESLQKKLLKAGERLPRYGADGVFGKETQTAVRTFQKRQGLVTDGIAGPKTFEALTNFLATHERVVRPYPGHVIRRGSTGSDVRAVQRAVGVKIDGIFGPKTEEAVKKVQRRYKLVDDGIVGPRTWKVLF